MEGVGESIALYNGNAAQVLAAMEGMAYDAVITDPPYSSGAMTLAGRQADTKEKYTNGSACASFEGDSMDQRSWSLFLADVLGKARRLCKPEAVCVVFSDWRQLPTATDAFQWAGWCWRGIGVWDKISPRPQKGRFRQQAEFFIWGSNGKLSASRPCPVLPGVFAHANVGTNKRLHQTQKPLELMRSLVKICVPGGHILDPFAGSGSTLEAAALEGYSATGVEINKTIADVAAERLGVSLRVGSNGL